MSAERSQIIVTRWRHNNQQTSFGGLSRSALMARVRSSRNATTELRFIELLKTENVHGWRRNFRLRGKPDFVFPHSRLAVFIDGCFWHGHNCRKLKPTSNAKAWSEKFFRTRVRDRLTNRTLRQNGWIVIRIWECVLSRSSARCIRKIKKVLAGGGRKRN